MANPVQLWEWAFRIKNSCWYKLARQVPSDYTSRVALGVTTGDSLALLDVERTKLLRYHPSSCWHQLDIRTGTWCPPHTKMCWAPLPASHWEYTYCHPQSHSRWKSACVKGEPSPLITTSSGQSHNLIFHRAGEGQKLFGLQSCSSPAEIPSGFECTHRDVSDRKSVV